MRIAVLLMLPAALWGQPSAVPGAACAADGFVVNAITGEPIPRAQVQIFGSAQSSLVADNSGRWRASAIGCGRLNFMASRTGFIAQPFPPGRLNNNGVMVSPDAPAHDVKIELTPQAVITGKVVDEVGDPVQNVQVTVMTSRVIEGRRTFQQSVGGASNDLGEYRIPGLASGKVIVCARAQNDMQFYQPGDGTILGESCYPGPVESGSAAAMSLAPGHEARVDFTLSRVASVKIRGRVTGAPENAGTMVSLQSRNGVRNGGQGRQSNMSRDGTFEVRGVPPGAWMLVVDYWEAGKRLFARVPVDVGGADLDGVVVHLEAGFTLNGTVRVETQSGKTPNPQQINVGLRAMDMTASVGGVQWDKAHQTFTISDATPGAYLLNANVPPPFYLKSAMLNGRDLSREAVTLGQSGGTIDVVIADDAGSVSGQIVDANGEAVSGWVMLLREGHPPLSNAVGPDGKFRLQGLPPGDYRVFGWDDFQQVEWADADWMRRNAGAGVAVTVSAGQSADAKVTRVVVPRD
jgi:hypothetical protein